MHPAQTTSSLSAGISVDNRNDHAVKTRKTEGEVNIHLSDFELKQLQRVGF